MPLTRRRFLTTSALSVAGAWVPGLATRGRQQPTPPAPRFEALRGGVGMFTVRGGTIGYLITSEGALVVDTQYADTAPACLEGLRARGAIRIELVVNTHHHADHTGGNQVFRPVVRHIVAHARVPELQKTAAAQAGSEAQQAYPDVTFENAWRHVIGRDTVSARHYGPAHTGGDAVVTFERANVVHMGDLVFNRVHPRVDRPAGASVVNWIATLERVAAEHDADTLYIFGHARADASVTGGRADLLFFRDYLSAAVEHVRKGLAVGASREAIVGSDHVPGFADFAPLGGRLTARHVLEMVYEELTAPGA